MKFNSPIEYETELRKQLQMLSDKNDWSAEDILSLKEYIYPINNHISYLLGKKFLDALNIPTDNFKYTEMNNNGYDIELEYNGEWIVAEIKGNIPCGNNNTYGAQQKEKIKENIGCLLNLNKKTKAKISKEIFDNAYKFLIILENNRNAIKNLEKNLNKCNNRYSFNYIDNIDWGNFIKGKINVVFINLNKN